MEGFKVKLVLRIDWSEMDILGHVNNVMYFKYIQAARVNYWEAMGFTEQLGAGGLGPMLASCTCQFKKPLYYPGQVTILSRVDYIKNTSFGISHRLLNDREEVVAEAQDVVVAYDFSSNQKVNMPQHLREKIAEIEGKSF